MKISIALATYNGALYLREQLESIALQSRLPDELVACDDASTDDTVPLLQDFAASASFELRIERNPVNLGYTGNFEKCLSMCRGDLVFLSDQDDRWYPRKLETVEAQAARNPGRHVFINDSRITDRHLQPGEGTVFGNSRRLGFGDAWPCMGCSTAVTGDFLRAALPFPDLGLAHDAWLHRLALSLDVRQVITEVLQDYRRHDANASRSIGMKVSPLPLLDVIRHFGLKPVLPAWREELALHDFLLVRLARLSTQAGPFSGNAGLAAEREIAAAALLQRRMLLVGERRFTRWKGVLDFYRTGGYASLSGWRSAAKDLVRPSERMRADLHGKA